jgi:hypothetical protein
MQQMCCAWQMSHKKPAIFLLAWGKADLMSINYSLRLRKDRQQNLM